MTDVIVTTLNLAAIYGLVAVGISITWAGLGFLNLAQGTTFAIAGYGAWWASDAHLVEQPRRDPGGHRHGRGVRRDHLRCRLPAVCTASETGRSGR